MSVRSDSTPPARANLPSKPLVVRPRRQADEALRHYVARVSEANGYPRPSHLLSALGVSELVRRTDINVYEPLAMAVSCEAEDIRRSGYAAGKGAGRRLRRTGLLGQAVPNYYLQVGAMPVCADCIGEFGYIDAYWHLRHAVGCPVHGRRALTRCPQCKSGLGWNRRGLSTCNCGCDLLTLPPQEELPADALGLLEILRRKASHKPIDTPELREAGYPLRDLEALSLADLVTLIQRLGYAGQPLTEWADKDPRGETRRLAEVVGAGRLLGGWPHRLHELADVYRERHPPASASGLVEPDAWYHDMRTALFSSGRAGHFAFVRHGFEDAIMGGLALGVFDRRERPEGFRPRYVGVTEFAQLAQVHPKTVRGLIRDGHLNAHLSRRGKKTRHVLLAEDAHALARRRHTSIDQRTAAKRLGLPVSVMRALRDQRLFDFEPSATLRGSFTERDVASLRRVLLRRAHRRKRVVPAEELVSLREILRRKPHTAEERAHLIAAIAIGEVPVWSGHDDDLGSLQIHCDDAELYLPGGTPPEDACCTPAQAAMALGTTQMAIETLAVRGHLESARHHGYTVISLRSLRRFAKRYVPYELVADAAEQRAADRRAAGKSGRLRHVRVTEKPGGREVLFVARRELAGPEALPPLFRQDPLPFAQKGRMLRGLALARARAAGAVPRDRSEASPQPSVHAGEPL